MLVEDDPDDQFIFQDALNELRSETTCNIANTALEAFDHLEKKFPLPSLILLDLNMPLMNGFEFLELIKKEKRTEHIPVIIYTTSGSSIDKKRASELGARNFLTKTSDFKSLKRTLFEILNDDLR